MSSKPYRDPFVTLMYRYATLKHFVGHDKAVKSLVDAGVLPEDVYFAYKATKILNRNGK